MLSMSLFIRDEGVNALARQVQKATKAKSKTEAVRNALRNELERAGKPVALQNRIRKFQQMTRDMGPGNPEFDLKDFMDDMWGEA
jgi:antitoxin VapB